MNTDWTAHFLTGIDLPASDVPALCAAAAPLEADTDWQPLVARFMAREYRGISEILDAAAVIGARHGIHRFTTHLLFYAAAAEPLLAEYRAHRVDEAIFWDTMRDLKYKYFECLAVKRIPGTFVPEWHAGFFHMDRFALGRLQYEYAPFHADAFSRGGLTLHRGDRVLNCHIPSSGPLTEASRLDSYRRAHDFYKNDFPGGVTPIVCSSWLLYPPHEEFLPPDSNILSFLHDFTILSSGVDEKFSNAWRVFGAAAARDPQNWPRDTRLRRAFADRILSGGTVGHGYGVIFFDGEKILR